MDQDLWNLSIFGGGDAERVESNVDLAEGLTGCRMLAMMSALQMKKRVQRWEDALKGTHLTQKGEHGWCREQRSRGQAMRPGEWGLRSLL